MFNNQVRQRVRGLVAGLGPSIVSNPDQLEAKLADLAASSPDEVRAVVAAARGGVAEEIAAAPAEHRAEMVEQAAAWMASETGLSPDISRWTVETWEEALQGVQIAPAAPAPVAPPNVAPVGAAQGTGSWPPQAGGPPPAPWDTPRAPQASAGAPWGAPPPSGAWQGQSPGTTYRTPIGQAIPGGAASRSNPASSGSPSTHSILLGILAATAIGIVGSIIIMKILFYAGVGLSLLYIALGYGIGFGLHKFTGTGKGIMPGIACLIMLVSLLVGHLVYINDAIHSAGAAGSVSFVDAIPIVMRSFSFVHWICIAIGIAACWRGVESQPN